MANVNINFTADSAKVENVIRNIDKEIQKVIAGSTALEQSFNSALSKTGTDFAELTQKVNGLGTAFEKMRGSTQLAQLAQASTVAGGAINTLIMELQGLSGASEENTQKIAQMIVSLQLNENSINQVTQVYQRYIQSLAVGSQAHTQAIAQLQLFQNAQMQLGATTAQASAGNGQLRNAVSQLGYTLGDASMFAVNFRMGMMAIGNNLPMIAQGFAQARASGLTWGQMLKQSVTGVNGFMLGLNALMLLMQVGPAIWDKFTGKVSASTTAMKEAQKAYNDSYFASVANINITKSLTTVLTDNTKTLDQKKNALGKIQEIYPDYLKGVDLDKIKQDDLNKAIADGNKLLETRAKTMAIQAELVELYKQKMKLEAETVLSNSKAGKLPDPAFTEQALTKQYGREAWRQGEVVTYNTGAGMKQARGYQVFENGKWRDLSGAESEALRFLAKNQQDEADIAKATAPIDAKITNMNRQLDIMIANSPKGTYVPSSSGSGKITSADERDKKILEKNLEPMLKFIEETKSATMEVLSNQLANGTITQDEYEIRKRRLDRRFLDDQAGVYEKFLKDFEKQISLTLKQDITIKASDTRTESNLAENDINNKMLEAFKASIKNVETSGLEMFEFTEKFQTLILESAKGWEKYLELFGKDSPVTTGDWLQKWAGKSDDEVKALKQTDPQYLAWMELQKLKKEISDNRYELQDTILKEGYGIDQTISLYNAEKNPLEYQQKKLQFEKGVELNKLEDHYNKQKQFYKAQGIDPDEMGMGLTDKYNQQKQAIEEHFARKSAEIQEQVEQQKRDQIKETLEFAKGAFREHTAAYKAMAIAQAGIDMWSAWQRALLLLSPWREIQQALILISGTANIARIASIPGFAKGGIVNSPTLGLVGEAGAEIIAPVSDYAKGQANLINAVKQEMMLNTISDNNSNLRVKIKGSDLILVSEKANTKQNGRKLGGLTYA